MVVCMRRTLLAGPLAGVAALIAVSCPAAAQVGNQVSTSAGWYIGTGIGANWGTTLEQEGWNRENYCYPDAACFDQDPIPDVSGYRWRYDIDLDAGATIEVFAGRQFGRARLELAVRLQRNDAEQQFTGITYFDGAPILPRPGGTVVSNSQAYVDNFNSRSFMLNGYYDFPGAWGQVTPYVGVGLGVASLELAGVHFSTEYQDTAGGSYDPPLSFYDSIQDADFRDTRFQWGAYAGADFPMTDRLLLGIKLSYSSAGDYEVTGAYEIHPFHAQDSDFTNTTRLSGPRELSLAVTLKRLIGS